MTTAYLDFEKPLADLEKQISDMEKSAGKKSAKKSAPDLSGEIAALRTKARNLLRSLYAKLDPWQKVLVARHAERPHGLDFIHGLIEEFTPLAGDRAFAEDHAIIGGPGRFSGRPVMVLAQEKGSDTDSRLHRNFGMARPEGYRKAMRLMRMAERFSMPLIVFVDTPGAYPGIGAEERGQAEAIAQSIACGLDLQIPSLCVVIGEGCSGGAIAIAAANKILMMEHAIYTVASPEASASILLRAATRAPEMARSMKITAQDLEQLGVIDEIIPEPLGGAHRAPTRAIEKVGEALAKAMQSMAGLDGEQLAAQRREKFLTMGRAGLEEQPA